MQATTTLVAGQATVRAEIRSAEYDDKFSINYQMYYSKIFAFIYSRTHDVELSKDLVSTVFERAYAKGHEVRQEAAYSAWLFMIARNTINGHFRRLQREVKYLERAGDELRFIDHPSVPEDALLRDERVGQLIQHIGTLPTRDRELLSLKFDAELTNAEIAKVVGMSPLNVRVALFRALRKLRAGMEKEEKAAA
jgi:RNA polymerase sigma-70 factor (ECF subfamily)